MENRLWKTVKTTVQGRTSASEVGEGQSRRLAVRSDPNIKTPCIRVRCHEVPKLTVGQSGHRQRLVRETSVTVQRLKGGISYSSHRLCKHMESCGEVRTSGIHV